ncbi:hypothetical protein pEaSNUABM11_00168 [Erwinia phage pEa_SNUABM_11]|nr:hypothetical protein pEaSNUABM11_00168 [Erwinia phage pEa_SNUABM_11]
MLNYAKPSSELVFDLINRDNPGLPIVVNSSNVIVESITAVPNNAANNFRNTKARLRGQQGSGFRDQIWVYYDRIDINKLLPWGNSTYSAFVTFTAPNIHGALAVIFDTYGVNWGTMDLLNNALGGVGVPNNSGNVYFQCQPTSPAYIGTVLMRYSRGLPVLDTSVTVDVVNAINLPVDPTLNQKCIDMLTYGIDFTAYKNLLTVDSSGLPQWAGLRKVMDDLGVPAYSAPLNSNTVQDVATSTAQFANKDYDRVVIQTGIDEAGVKGNAYYHYNS